MIKYIEKIPTAQEFNYLTNKVGWYFLDELWLDENYRKNGIGTMLIEKNRVICNF